MAPQRCRVLIPGICKCDFIWTKGLCRSERGAGDDVILAYPGRPCIVVRGDRGQAHTGEEPCGHQDRRGCRDTSHRMPGAPQMPQEAGSLLSKNPLDFKLQPQNCDRVEPSRSRPPVCGPQERIQPPTLSRSPDRDSG